MLSKEEAEGVVIIVAIVQGKRKRGDCKRGNRRSRELRLTLSYALRIRKREHYIVVNESREAREESSSLMLQKRVSYNAKKRGKCLKLLAKPSQKQDKREEGLGSSSVIKRYALFTGIPASLTNVVGIKGKGRY